MLHQGGIPTTLEHTGEQWDYPNAWPPLQHIMVEGLARSGDDWAKELAFDIASRWVRSNYEAYNKTGHMFEKVNYKLSIMFFPLKYIYIGNRVHLVDENHYISDYEYSNR